ncbi:MAG: hypothetical protein LBS21_09310 [Clostridiales bacterium]|jgi:predicted amidophosphoribosyltransferase|nr:hypothetical protein [Clostridiales bacterium]
MKYKPIKMKTCPFCNKTVTAYLSNNICSSCGRDISNRCLNENCGEKLDSAARYCKTCGGKSFYFSLGLLKPWQLEEQE